MSTGVVVNGRFLARRVTGVERYAIEIFHRIQPRVRLIKPGKPVSGFWGHIWEQWMLPQFIHTSETLWSPANSGPLNVPNQVLSLHDMSVIDHPEWFNRSYALWYRLLLPRLVKIVKRIITVSEFSKSRIMNIFNLPADLIRCIPEGVDSNYFYPHSLSETSRIQQRYGLAGEYLLLVATLEPRKNIGRLLQAWELRKSGLKNSWLVIVGGRYRVFRDIKIIDHSSNVRWLGYVDEQDLPGLYSGAQAFILPSLYEGFGLSALEAMACGTPVIVSRAGALPELVGNSGIFIDPHSIDSIAQAIDAILGNHPMRKDLREKGLERAKMYSWNHTAQEVWRELEDANS